MAFVVDKVALGQVFSGFFGFPCQSSFHQLLQSHYHLSSGPGIIGQTVDAVTIGLSLTPLRIIIIRLYVGLEVPIAVVMKEFYLLIYKTM
jgi:hypothetical protein